MTYDHGEWPPRVTVERVHELHRRAIAHAGGMPGVRDAGLLESAVNQAYTAALYTTEIDALDPLRIAAYLLCYIVRNHPFVDGNKRVAWLSCEDQLRMVKLRILATTDDAEQLVLDVVAKRKDAQQVVMWLAERLEAYTP